MAQPIGSQIGNAPELPSIPDLNTRLADYLRRFALWSQGNFNSCIQKRSATGELFMHSVSGQSVWSLTVDDSGRLQTTQILPGSHQASVGATLTFAPITKYGESAIANPTGTTS